ncbi:hypothetical protein Rumeso_01987 [Rubellimicrobium mesophilum DSM 19309]|uniref:Uncharacterized protein n=1 Tax=Rubellimicrobium mesophilum DSM 19309 TaxID=442562 RepID=A0A017HRN8_9RHOB|nr:hypothetical protein Rumeso_01987 [Rubellimicrobium mesophilum DSM 19309]
MLVVEPAAAQSARDDTSKLVSIQGIRSATVAPSGLAYGAVALTNRQQDGDEFVDGPEGSLSFGFGVGDASRTVGLQFSVNLTSLSDGVGESGSLSIKASRRLGGLRVPTYVGLSVDRLAGWGEAEDFDPSTSLAVTMFPRIEVGDESYPLMLTAGVGSDIVDDQSDPGVFLGAGVGLTHNLGASVAWTGETVSLGTVFRVDGLDSMRFGASVDDVFDQEDRRRLVLTATFFVDDLFGR